MTERFTFFWRGTSPFSQWHMAPFTLDGVTNNCAEQFMMAGKARLFADLKTEQRILASTRPADQKSLGRAVKPFDPAVWNENARRIVYQGNEAKFTQNDALLGALMSTRGTTLVEASPTDTIWGHRSRRRGRARAEPCDLARAELARRSADHFAR